MADQQEQLRETYKAWMAATDSYTSAWRKVIEGHDDLNLQVMQDKIADMDRCLTAFHRTAMGVIAQRQA